MDAIKAFLQFLTDLFSALAAFLGNTGIFGDIVDGIGNISGVVDDATAGNADATDGE